MAWPIALRSKIVKPVRRAKQAALRPWNLSLVLSIFFLARGLTSQVCSLDNLATFEFVDVTLENDFAHL